VCECFVKTLGYFVKGFVKGCVKTCVDFVKRCVNGCVDFVKRCVNGWSSFVVSQWFFVFFGNPLFGKPLFGKPLCFSPTKPFAVDYILALLLEARTCLLDCFWANIFLFGPAIQSASSVISCIFSPVVVSVRHQWWT